MTTDSEGHLADLILDLIWLHTEEDVSLNFILNALALVKHDVQAEFQEP